MGQQLDQPVPKSAGLTTEAVSQSDVRPAGDGGGGGNAGPARVSINFTPSGKQVRVPAGVSVFEAGSWNGIAIDSTCGGYGTCKKCKVQMTAGSLPVTSLDTKAFSADELAAGWRLACRAIAMSDLDIEVPPLTTRPKAATVGVGRKVILRPALQMRYVEMSEPTLKDQRSDLERLLDAIDDLELEVDVDAIRELATALRKSSFAVTAVVVGSRLVSVEPGDITSQRYGLAFDLGTTTVVATLLDTATGAPLAVQSMLNRQQPFGADVISRISATMLDPEALPKLRELAQETLAELTLDVCGQAGVEPSQIYDVSLAGNVTMTEIVLGIDPEPLGVAPFITAARYYPTMLASELGVPANPRARATVFPSLGAYVGGDIVAGMLASGMDRDRRTRLFIDVGTNCEIVLGNRDRLLATAAPAGPAFEGAQIRCGMRAAPGAVESVRLREGRIDIGVIGDAAPLGICGSGLVDAVATLLDIGMIDPSGRFVSSAEARDKAPELADRLIEVDGERSFVLAWRDEAAAEQPIYLSQRDVRELQFAKAAIATGWHLLVEELGIEIQEISQVLLAGSFGSYLSPASATRIGLVPRLPLMRIVSAGNVAGEGAKMALLSEQERAGAVTLTEEVRYVELSDRPDFNDQFIERLAFPT